MWCCVIHVDGHPGTHLTLNVQAHELALSFVEIAAMHKAERRFKLLDPLKLAVCFIATALKPELPDI